MKKTKSNRKPRKDSKRITPKKAQKPLDVSMIGTEDDPCFGKLYEPATEECHGCGDSELCAIVHMHNLDKRRKKIEKKQKFKDLEPAASKITFMSLTKLGLLIQDKVKELGEIRFKALVDWVKETHDPSNLMPPGRISELVKTSVKSNKRLKREKKNGKNYIIHV
jgi:hypothetical protein